MRINHNIAALNTYRQLTSNNLNTGKSLEKLSSGLRINRAGDDAAGLAISEKMRGQIRGLEQATRNSQDGISMIQTAEGALNETQSILQRMRELAVQSSNDTNTAKDRGEIQKEVDQLAQEITRVANNTEFNTQNLLNGGIKVGNIGDVKFQIGANADQNLSLEISAMDAFSLGVTRDTQTATVSSAVDVTSATLSGTLGTALTDGATLTLSANDTATKTQWTAASLGITGTSLASTTESSTYNDYKIIVTKTGATGADVTAALDSSNKTITINYASDVAAAGSTAAKLNTALTGAGIALTASGDATAVAGVASPGAAATTAGLAADEVKLSIGTGSVIVKDTATSATFTDAANKGLTVNLDGSLSAATAATITIDINNSSSATFANNAKTADANAAAGIDVSTQAAANTAITTINSAIESVSGERSKLGAYQNRLEHTINNLSTSAENLTASESRIRDVDMAKEMMEFTKNNILSQAAQAMLAQANQQPQGVLQLLR
jgi:flagellin